MLPLCYLTVSLLWSLPFLSSVFPLNCNETQYEWPMQNPKNCCKKCPPGFHYISRSQESCDIKCEPCKGERYMDSYNLETTCYVCDVCNKANFEKVSSCKPTTNTVCKCSVGYRCKDGPCTKCEPVPTTIKSTPPPSTTEATGFSSTTRTTIKPNNPIRDTQWYLVIIVLLCAGIALVVVTKIKPFLHWIRSNQGYFLPQKVVVVSPCAVDDDVSKPVQEVCGKCDHCIDLCIKD
ncbi:tumor necrosis factor receptor superfamily member 23 [Fundulus heteroclitus]|uniref:tumor necrosis factor receptor superfamily member 23 n=1 Tax=Fundulus heteroclitus TaxID=8078 RepID=UPI00165C933D|nr:tumor necrosis factor receptor superfamily member 23 [Fundulus heteroclitus]